MNIIEVTSETFSNEVLNSEKSVVIDFYANWCGPCKMLRPILEELANERNDFKFVSINIDEEENLANDFEILSIPTLVLINNGKEVKRNVGLASKEQLVDFLGEI